MKVYLITLLFFISFSLFSQQDSAIIKQSTSYFCLDSIGGFKGDGADFIQNRIAESHFFLIGEQHEVHLIEKFLYALIPFLKERGYQHYLTEIGPVAAAKLTELSENSGSLKTFYSKYNAQTKLKPFGFFATKEEERTLQQLKKYTVHLGGIDFESYEAYLFLIDEIYKNADQGKVSEALYQQVYAFVESEYKKGDNNFNPKLMENLLQSACLQNFLAQARNQVNTLLIEQFELSLTINQQLTLGYWQRRVDNMKNNFRNYYQRLATQDPAVKLFLKLGAVHTSRGLSFSGNLEVGNMIYELGNLNQSKSFSIITFPRYILNSKTAEITDILEDENKAILSYTSPDQWTVIDLHRLAELSIQRDIPLDKTTVSYIQKYDAIIIPPATSYAEKL